MSEKQEISNFSSEYYFYQRRKVINPLVMARVTGLEPATSGVTGRRSNQLSYYPKSRASEESNQEDGSQDARFPSFITLISIRLLEIGLENLYFNAVWVE